MEFSPVVDLHVYTGDLRDVITTKEGIVIPTIQKQIEFKRMLSQLPHRSSDKVKQDLNDIQLLERLSM